MGKAKTRVLIVTGLFGLLSSAAATAQTLQGGVKGGLSLSDVPRLTADFKDEGAEDLRYRRGLIIGGFAIVRLADRIAFQPEALYTQKGMRGRDPLGPSDGFEIRADYVDVPLLVRLQPGGGSGMYVLAGPSVNFNVAAKVVADGEEEDIEDDVKDVEASFVAGFGVQLSRFLVEGRYSEGLTNLVQDPEPGDDTYRHRSFAILIGVRFP